MTAYILEKDIHIKAFESLVIFCAAFFVCRLISLFFAKTVLKRNPKYVAAGNYKTYVKLISSVSQYAVMLFALISVLNVFGVNIKSVLAGVGVLGVIFGLALQDWLKDIFRGVAILSDEYFKVGDVVRFHDQEGKVTAIGLRTTKIQDIDSGNIIAVANRNIEEVEKVSDFFHVRIPVSYDVPVLTAEAAVSSIINMVLKTQYAKDCKYLGITELADSSVQYYIRVYCNPENKRQCRRDALRCVMVGLSENGLSVPYNQLDVHSIVKEEVKAIKEAAPEAVVKKVLSVQETKTTRKMKIVSDLSNIDAILEETFEFAGSLSLKKTEANKMVLLTEEAVSIAASFGKDAKAKVQLKGTPGKYTIHVEMEKFLGREEKADMIAMSSSGKNEAESTVVSSIRDVIERMLHGSDQTKSWSSKKTNFSKDRLGKTIIEKFSDDVRIWIRGKQVVLEIDKNIDVQEKTK